MSCYEWEEGTFKLPTAEFARVRKAIQDAVAKRQQAQFDHTQRFWKGLSAKQRKDLDAYNRAASAYVWGNRIVERLQPDGTRRVELEHPELPESNGIDTGNQFIYGHTGADMEELSDMLRTKWGQTTPRRVLKKDIDWVTNRTTAFKVGDDAYITFDRDASTVTWAVHENNRACETARSHPLARTFFATLDSVRWTRGTGGEIIGNDEYNRESRAHGGGGNYWKNGYGPLANNPWDQARQRAAKQVSGQGRVGRGVPAGGQFASRYHPEASGHL